MPIICPAAIAYLIGILAGRYIEAPIWVTGVCAAVAAASAMAARGRERLYAAALIAGAFFASWFLFGVNETIQGRTTLGIYLEGRESDRVLEKIWGTVTEVRRRDNGRVCLTVQTDEVRLSSDRRLRVSGKIMIYYSEETERTPGNGERWAFEGWIRPMEGMNHGARTYYELQGVTARMTPARQGCQEYVGPGAGGALMRFGGGLRKRFERTLAKHVDAPYNQVLGRMITGKSQDMDGELYEKFRRAGVVHVLVVSGMHVWIMLTALFGLGFVWNRRPVPSFIVMVLGLAVYYAVAGGGPSVLRATLMGLVFLVALLRGAEYSARSAVFIAALLIMVMNPLAVFQIGTQLTFLASAGVIFIYPALAAFFPGRAWWFRIVRVLLISVAAQLPLYPVLAYHFNQFCFVAPVSNVFVVPLIGVLLPLDFVVCLAGLLPGNVAAAPAFFAEWITRLVTAIVKVFSIFPYSSIDVASPGLVWMAVYGAAVLLLLWTLRRMADGTDRQIVGGWLGIAALGALLMFGSLWRPPMRELRVTFFDVGEGDATLVEAPASAGGYRVFRMLVDGGGVWGYAEENFEPGERVIGRHLKRRGIRRLDAVVLSHHDAEHMNGLLWVFENVKVDRFIESALPADIACEELKVKSVCEMASVGKLKHEISENQTERYRALLRLVKGRGIEYVHARSGTEYTLPSGAEARIFGPDRGVPYMRLEPRNELSVVARVKYGAGAVLLTGDIQSGAESRLARWYGGALAAQLMKSPHHGSATSSSDLFLKWVRPEIVVISTGGPGFYGHPHEEALKRYAAAGVSMFRTDLMGTVVCRVRRDGETSCGTGGAGR